MMRCMGCMREFSDELAACPRCGHPKGGMPADGNHLPESSILAKRYVVGKAVGSGGFGVTYIGYDFELERIVAIKEYLPGEFASRSVGTAKVSAYSAQAEADYAQGLSNFAEEARRLATFSTHPNIVHIFDSFEQNGTAYITMEYLEGSTVKDALKARGRLPYEEARAIIIAVLDALEAVHGNGIIHRDVAPDNIFITNCGLVKLIDFGTARFAMSEKSRSMTVILKPGYAPEEQYRSKGKQGTWTDVYAAAATFYKMLTGTTPDESLNRLVGDTLVRPSVLGVKMPVAAESALMAALVVNAKSRTQTAGDFKAGILGLQQAQVQQRQQPQVQPHVRPHVQPQPQPQPLPEAQPHVQPHVRPQPQLQPRSEAQPHVQPQPQPQPAPVGAGLPLQPDPAKQPQSFAAAQVALPKPQPVQMAPAVPPGIASPAAPHTAAASPAVPTAAAAAPKQPLPQQLPYSRQAPSQHVLNQAAQAQYPQGAPYASNPGIDVNSDKSMAVLAYILFFVPLVTGAHKRSPFVRFHANQGTVLAIAAAFYCIGVPILLNIFKLVFRNSLYNYSAMGAFSTVSSFLGIATLAFVVMAAYCIYYAVKGQAKELPALGRIKLF